MQCGGELSFRLPFDDVASFGLLLRELDTRGADLKLGGYGMSMTSMEEVFLRLAQVSGTPSVLRPHSSVVSSSARRESVVNSASPAAVSQP